MWCVGGCGLRGHAGKVVDIKRMTKDPNPGFFIFPFLGGVCGGGGAQAVQGMARAGVGRGVGAIICICNALY